MYSFLRMDKICYILKPLYVLKRRGLDICHMHTHTTNISGSYILYCMRNQSYKLFSISWQSYLGSSTKKRIRFSYLHFANNIWLVSKKHRNVWYFLYIQDNKTLCCELTITLMLHQKFAIILQWKFLPEKWVYFITENLVIRSAKSIWTNLYFWVGVKPWRWSFFWRIIEIHKT